MFKYILLLLLITSTPIFAQTELPLSLDVNQIEVRQVLLLLANYRHLNIVMSEGVQGKITLHLTQLPWSQVLAIILQQTGLTAHYQGKVLMINPTSEWQNQQQINQNNESLHSSFITLHYAKATQLQELLKGNTLLSPRGIVIADNRTNSLWLRDIPEKIVPIRAWIKQLDRPVQQILIAARIVNVNTNAENELGIRFGITRPGNQLTGSLAGANQLAQQISPSAINPLQRLNVDLPTVIPHAATIGLALAKLGGGTLLDIELSALASEGKGEVISKPELMTSDGVAATILSGQEIPYQQATSSGATSVHFQKAVLSLTVTPQILPNKHLLLNLQLNQDQPTATLINGVPSIATRQIQTQVIVDNQQTIVLGGIYEQTQENQRERVPMLSALPLIGELFQHKIVKNHQRELLIFITPEIVAASP